MHGGYLLRHVLGKIEGYYVSGYADGGDAPDKQLAIVPGAMDDATAMLKEQPDTLQRFERVAELVDGFESSFGMELLATVHWVMKREGAKNGTLVSTVHNWNARKRTMTDRQIHMAAERLGAQGWV